MSRAHTVFNGTADNFYDPNISWDINKKMHVPESIRVCDDCTEGEVIGTNGSEWNQVAAEKFDMHVPDRILVVGQGQHIGTRAPPREITLENAILPSDPDTVRLQTPPRILTLDNHYFPAVDEDEPNTCPTEFKDPVPFRAHNQYSTETQIVRHAREQTPSFNTLDVSHQSSEEIQHLRRQVGKLNRRVMAIELDMLQRQQKNKIIYAVTLTYFILKALSWLTRN
ncbi:transport and Golgi organization protein 11 [Colletes gigas]|uniref:transport and Golgi organization protein 11 n=1 Tax=Colletes gigas TaxID=935657 RepID=UPI001C9B890A|nr:transport and Golgi organization protein 11 [Colletes gigas]XP_043261738.1 transport and Golgi organization protein 11 [Colletes gigas]XP_043261747.1 transport and Golgi organization protein 11 [Colletes gigas]